MARRINIGPGRALLLVYAVFALSASVRAGFQLVTKFSDAPVAYLLSAFAAAIYVVATVALAQGGETARKIALVACSIELVGRADGRARSATCSRTTSPTPRCGRTSGRGTGSSRWCCRSSG